VSIPSAGATFFRRVGGAAQPERNWQEERPQGPPNSPRSPGEGHVQRPAGGESRPLYGEAAAIHALYQAAFLEQDPPSPTPPRPKGRGRSWLARTWNALSTWSPSFGASLRCPATSIP